MRNRLSAVLILVMALVGLAAADVSLVREAELNAHERIHAQKIADRATNRNAMVPTTQVGRMDCVDGLSGGEFACDGIDLLSFIPLDELGEDDTLAALGGGASDIWGWTSPDTGDEYILMGHTNGTAAVDVTDPENPVYLGSVPNSSPVQLVWHDIKVINDHAIIGSESIGHGLQILDMTKLDGLDGSTPQVPILFDALYPLSGSQHNVVANDVTDQLIVVGGSFGGILGGGDECGSGLNVIDFSNPLLPVPEGCYDGFGYVHDAQCVIYEGPDAEHQGKNICASFSEDETEIVDITDVANPVSLSVITYADTEYTHQGWFSEDFRYLFFNDELDEQGDNAVTHTRTLVYDVTDLDNPVEHIVALRDGSDGNPATESIDHNLYTHEGLLYQSNYTSGLRVIDVAGLDAAGGPVWDEVAFFDTYPADDGATFNGTWSNYPYFESGTIAVSGIGEGLFLLKLQDAPGEAETPAAPSFRGHFSRLD